MAEPLPDHYKALGVDKNADVAAIKATYRKLALKCHPDKVTDPTLKQQATDQFHQIQQAYETLVDEEKRSDYEARLTLEKLRAARGSARVEKSTRFDGGAPSAGRSSRYATEERRPSQAPYEDDRYTDDRARSSYDTYDAYPKTGATARPTRTEKEVPRSPRPAASDRTRSDREKTRAREGRSDRKFVSVESESSSDEKARHEANYKRRSAEAQDDARRQADLKRKEDRRSYEESRYAPQTQRKMSSLEEEALRYQHKSRAQVEAEIRPSPVRTSSRDYYGAESRSSRREVRPEPVRRSSARPSGRDRDRGKPEIVDWSEERRNDERRSEERRPPMFKHSSSSPADLHVPRGTPQRSFTEAPIRRSDDAPPSFSRSATMPIGHSTGHSTGHSSSSRRKEATPVRPSGLRNETMTPEHSSPERDTYPSIPTPQSASGKKIYYYPTAGGVTLRPDEASKPRTVLREPVRHQRSPSPIGKPPIGANRPTDSSAAYSKSAARPPLPERTTSTRHFSPPRASEDRERSARPKLYRTVDDMDSRRGRQPSYNPSNVSYAPAYGPEDVKWSAPRGRENERYAKPGLARAATSVY